MTRLAFETLRRVDLSGIHEVVMCELENCGERGNLGGAGNTVGVRRTSSCVSLSNEAEAPNATLKIFLRTHPGIRSDL